MMNLEEIKKIALQQGFSLCGVAPACRLDGEEERFREWLARGDGEGLGYMERNVEKRLDPRLLVEGARSVVVCGIGYKNEHWNQTAIKADHKVASYALVREYHKSIKEMLHAVLSQLKERYPELGGRCFVDTAPMLEKSWAVKAGLGWIGRNSLLINPTFGSFLLLGEIVLDREVSEYDRPYAEDGCGRCRVCVEKCPSEAIRPNRTIDTRRCISRLTVERPIEGRKVEAEELNGWLFGCDECQSCCPCNATTPLSTHPQMSPVISLSKLTPQFWRELTESGFNDVFADTPLARVGYELICERVRETPTVDE